MHRIAFGGFAALALVCSASAALAAPGELRLSLENDDNVVVFKQGIIGPEMPPGGIIGPERNRYNNLVEIQVGDFDPPAPIRLGYFLIIGPERARAIGLLAALGFAVGADAPTIYDSLQKYGIIGPEEPNPIVTRQTSVPRALTPAQASTLALTFQAALAQDTTLAGRAALDTFIAGAGALGVPLSCGIIGPE